MLAKASSMSARRGGAATKAAEAEVLAGSRAARLADVVAFLVVVAAGALPLILANAASISLWTDGAATKLAVEVLAGSRAARVAAESAAVVNGSSRFVLAALLAATLELKLAMAEESAGVTSVKSLGARALTISSRLMSKVRAARDAEDVAEEPSAAARWAVSSRVAKGRTGFEKSILFLVLVFQ